MSNLALHSSIASPAFLLSSPPDHACVSLSQLSSPEAKSVVQFLPHYFRYMEDAYTNEKPTLLAKIVGIYRIGFSNTATRQSLRQEVYIMENLFYDRQVAHIYDLKVGGWSGMGPCCCQHVLLRLS